MVLQVGTGRFQQYPGKSVNKGLFQCISAPEHNWKFLAFAAILVLSTVVALVGQPWQGQCRCATLQETSKDEQEQNDEIGGKIEARGNTSGLDERDANRIACLLDLKREFKQVVSRYVKGKNAILLDQVHHWNIGDSFIEYGEKLLLADLGSPVRIPCYGVTFFFGTCNMSRIAEAMESDPRAAILLLHGGGNFGDLYPNHRRFINEYMQRFPATPFLLLPQSVYYTKSTTAKRDAQIRAKHPDFHLLVRDLRSLDEVRRLYPGQVSQLSPDAAQYIGPVDRAQCKPSVDALFLTRADGEEVPLMGNPLEAAQALTRANLTFRLTDWHDYKGAMLKHKLTLPTDPLDFAEFRTSLGIKMLCEGRMIVTDRLHATIMSTLMGLPYVYLDNSYGKIQSYRAAIYQPRPNCSDKNLRAARADTWHEAVEIVKKVFQEDPPS